MSSDALAEMRRVAADILLVTATLRKRRISAESSGSIARTRLIRIHGKSHSEKNWPCFWTVVPLPTSRPGGRTSSAGKRYHEAMPPMTSSKLSDRPAASRARRHGHRRADSASSARARRASRSPRTSARPASRSTAWNAKTTSAATGTSARAASSVYRSTRLISSKPLTEYTDFPMPAHYPDHPDQDDGVAVPAELCRAL